MIGWTLRDLVRCAAPRLDAVLGSAVGLLTVASWIRDDPSPFATLDRVASWLGVNITRAVHNADRWLNADHRHDVLVLGGIAVLLVALAQQAVRLASNHAELAAASALDDKSERTAVVREHRRWVGACETRFWAIVWLMVGLLSQLREASSSRVLAALSVILIIRFGADLLDARAISNNTQRNSTNVGFTFGLSISSSLAWAALTLTAVVGRVYGVITQPRMKARAAERDL